MADARRPNRLDETAIASRRQKVAGLYLRRQSQQAIARQLGVSQSTVSEDLAAMREEWATEQIEDIRQVVVRELEELAEVERDASIQFASTKEPAYLALRLRCKERRAKMLGLDQPTRQDLTTGGAPFKVYVGFSVDEV